ncbi:MAG: hypothetical protein PHI06_06550 [Desulfobulbaceae bacterium]|nr:hypothetical protein [Desulfobulbaceae bacterium]
MDQYQRDSAASISFGWDRSTDERSCQAFIQRFSRPNLLSVLTPRLTDQELTALIDHLSVLMKQHLSEREYHRLFLADSATKRV